MKTNRRSVLILSLYFLLLPLFAKENERNIISYSGSSKQEIIISINNYYCTLFEGEIKNIASENFSILYPNLRKTINGFINSNIDLSEIIYDKATISFNGSGSFNYGKANEANKSKMREIQNDFYLTYNKEVMHISQDTNIYLYYCINYLSCLYLNYILNPDEINNSDIQLLEKQLLLYKDETLRSSQDSIIETSPSKIKVGILLNEDDKNHIIGVSNYISNEITNWLNLQSQLTYSQTSSDILLNIELSFVENNYNVSYSIIKDDELISLKKECYAINKIWDNSIINSDLNNLFSNIGLLNNNYFEIEETDSIKLIEYQKQILDKEREEFIKEMYEKRKNTNAALLQDEIRANSLKEKKLINVISNEQKVLSSITISKNSKINENEVSIITNVDNLLLIKIFIYDKEIIYDTTIKKQDEQIYFANIKYRIIPVTIENEPHAYIYQVTYPIQSSQYKIIISSVELFDNNQLIYSSNKENSYLYTLNKAYYNWSSEDEWSFIQPNLLKEDKEIIEENKRIEKNRNTLNFSNYFLKIKKDFVNPSIRYTYTNIIDNNKKEGFSSFSFGHWPFGYLRWDGLCFDFGDISTYSLFGVGTGLTFWFPFTSHFDIYASASCSMGQLKDKYKNIETFSSGKYSTGIELCFGDDLGIIFNIGYGIYTNDKLNINTSIFVFGVALGTNAKIF